MAVHCFLLSNENQSAYNVLPQIRNTKFYQYTNETSLKIIMHSAAHSVGLETKINVSVPKVVDVVLVEYVIQTFI